MPLHHPKEKENKRKIKIVSVQVFYNKSHTPVSVSILKPLLRTIEVIPLKPQASSIVGISI